jgi:putative transposase
LSTGGASEAGKLVVDAIDMARWRCKPAPGTVLHSDRGAQFTSWLFGNRLREAGLMGSMGKVTCAYDNAFMESFFGSMQIELLDRRDWSSRAELANGIFEWIEAFYTRRGATHRSATSAPSSSKHVTPPPTKRHDQHTPRVRETRDRSPIETRLLRA